ncbi:MAG: hypothetical protein C0621_09130 [Desulfuromonas sp.]|nr:MAG: hypothetical protein C0621_09130 [Desulfuromonas sp.]
MTLFLGFSAVNTGNNLLYLVVSVLLGFMAISGLLGKRNLDDVWIAIETPDEIYAGLPTLLTVQLENRRKAGAFLLDIELEGKSVLFPATAGGSRAALPLSARFENRGRQPLPTLRLRSIYPVNFFIRSRAIPFDEELIVFPRLRQLVPEIAGEGEKEPGEHQERGRGHEGELNRISDYSGREPLRQIHWKLSARQDQLKVKEFSPPQGEPLMIDLQQIAARNLEERLSIAATLVASAIAAGHPTGLNLPERQVPPASGRTHKLHLLRELALYDRP